MITAPATITKLDMRGRHGKHVKGSRHPRWNPGRILDKQGYVLIRVGKAHPMADKNGYCYEHDLIAVAALGRPLKPNEVVHHRNEDRQDNRLENLEITQRGAHSSLHSARQGRDKHGRFLSLASSVHR